MRWRSPAFVMTVSNILQQRLPQTTALHRTYVLWTRLRQAKLNMPCAALHCTTSQRNGMLGGDYSTKFAPWLAAGCLSPRTIYHQIKQYEAQRAANKSTYWCGCCCSC